MHCALREGGVIVERKLELVFLNEAGKKFVLTIDDPRDNLTAQEIKQAMEEIIRNNVFESSMLDLVEIEEARLVTTTIEKFNI